MVQDLGGDALYKRFTDVPFPGRLLMLGCGSIGQCVLPMLLRHTDMTPDRMRILTADETGRAAAAELGIAFTVEPLSQDTYTNVLTKYLRRGDFLLNLSVDVSSIDLIDLCQKQGVLYVDTSVERWPGFSTNHAVSIVDRTIYAEFEQVQDLQRKHGAGVTAVINHGANPGLVNQFVKQALMHIARDTCEGMLPPTPRSREEWANLMHDLKVRVIQVAERDTQSTKVIKQPGEFVNTWSIDGFIVEAVQPVEVGWGTHEKELPADAHEHTFGDKAAVYLDRPGALTPVRSWTPREGSYHGFLITHSEAISTSDYYTCRDGDTVTFRPTAMYAYHPCDDAVLSLREYAGNNWKMPRTKRILMDEIERGSDELGVLLMGHKKRAYWYGSDLSIAQARELVPNQNATVMQVAAGALAAVVWALENPEKGICGPEDLDFQRVLEVALPYLGTVHGTYTSWTPLRDRRNPLFPDDMNLGDPWQFKNFRV